MKVEVEMLAFGKGAIRQVELPGDAPSETKDLLDAVFHYGQNEQQSLPLPSVSVGDVVRWGGERWLVAPTGFVRVTPGAVCAACGGPFGSCMNPACGYMVGVEEVG